MLLEPDIKKLAVGKTPVMALQREVVLDPSDPDAVNQYQRILLLRELALTRNTFKSAAKQFWQKEDGKQQTIAIKKALAARHVKSRILNRTEMRLSSYLRMIRSETSIKLADHLDMELGVKKKN